MNADSLNVLVLCTGNSCRSIMAEALLNEVARTHDIRLSAYSAGSRPAGFVHPQAIACLNRNRVPVEHPNSKSWDDFVEQRLELVITVCSNAANETCPVFPSAPVRAHWGLPDPALASGTDAEVANEFQAVFDSLRAHVELFVGKLAGIEQPTAGQTSSAQLTALLEDIGAPQAPAASL